MLLKHPLPQFCPSLCDVAICEQTLKLKILQLNQFPGLVCHISTHRALPAQWGVGNVMTTYLKTGSTSEKTYMEPHPPGYRSPSLGRVKAAQGVSCL